MGPKRRHNTTQHNTYVTAKDSLPCRFTCAGLLYVQQL